MMNGNEGDELIPGENPNFGDLGNVNLSGDNPGWLQFDGTEWQDHPVIHDGDAFVFFRQPYCDYSSNR